MYDRFVKLPMRVLSMDISAEAKLLYSILADRVAYSQFEDERGRYYFLSSADREDLMRMVGCAVCAYKRHMKLLRDRGMIYTHQHRNGVRIYIDEVVSNQYSEVVSKLSHPLNHNTKLEKQENYTDSEQNIITAHNTMEGQMIIYQPTFIDVLAYWKEKGYHSSPADFFNRYSLQGWIIDGKPVYNWKRLADFWEGSEFTVPLYDCERVISSIPEALKQTIIKEQEISGGRIRQRTYDQLKHYL